MVMLAAFRSDVALRIARRASRILLNAPKSAFSMAGFTPAFLRLSGDKLPWLRRFTAGLTRNGHFHTSTALAAATVEPVAIVAEKKPIEYFRKDYKPSPYVMSHIELHFNLDESETTVVTRNLVVRGKEVTEDMILDGEELELVSVRIDGQSLNPLEYKYSDDKLIIPFHAINRLSSSTNFILETVNRINPAKNLALSGLYRSGQSLLCTQCEAMGFRRITFSLDRPDILSKYRVRLEGEKSKYPLLLSNGNLVDSGDINATHHY
eukprot:gene31383-37932_t